MTVWLRSMQVDGLLGCTAALCGNWRDINKGKVGMMDYSDNSPLLESKDNERAG